MENAHDLLKNCMYLKKRREIEIKAGRSSSTAPFPKCPLQPFLGQMEAWRHNSIPVSHLVPTASATTCCFPGYLLAGSWNREWSHTETRALRCRMCNCRTMSQLLWQMLAPGHYPLELLSVFFYSLGCLSLFLNSIIFTTLKCILHIIKIISFRYTVSCHHKSILELCMVCLLIS